jgi:hypothetical protein
MAPHGERITLQPDKSGRFLGPRIGWGLHRSCQMQERCGNYGSGVSAAELSGP